MGTGPDRTGMATRARRAAGCARHGTCDTGGAALKGCAFGLESNLTPFSFFFGAALRQILTFPLPQRPVSYSAFSFSTSFICGNY